MKNQPYLYRALRAIEIEAGNILIPKSQDPFKGEIKIEVDTRFPWTFGATEAHAVNQHQWKQNGFPTRGISTTPHLERARFYAQANKVIVKIERSQFSKYRIREYVVKEWVALVLDIAIPEDDEIILVQEVDGAFPKEIICDVITLE